MAEYITVNGFRCDLENGNSVALGINNDKDKLILKLWCKEPNDTLEACKENAVKLDKDGRFKTTVGFSREAAEHIYILLHKVLFETEVK